MLRGEVAVAFGNGVTGGITKVTPEGAELSHEPESVTEELKPLIETTAIVAVAVDPWLTPTEGTAVIAKSPPTVDGIMTVKIVSCEREPLVPRIVIM